MHLVEDFLFYPILKVVGEKRQRQQEAFVWFIFVSVFLGGVLFYHSNSQEGGCFTLSIIALVFLLAIGPVQVWRWSRESSMDVIQEVPQTVITTQPEHRESWVKAMFGGGIAGLLGSIIIHNGGHWLVTGDWTVPFCFPLVVPLGMIVGAGAGSFAWNHDRPSLLYGAGGGVAVGAVALVMSIMPWW